MTSIELNYFRAGFEIPLRQPERSQAESWKSIKVGKNKIEQKGQEICKYGRCLRNFANLFKTLLFLPEF